MATQSSSGTSSGTGSITNDRYAAPTWRTGSQDPGAQRSPSVKSSVQNATGEVQFAPPIPRSRPTAHLDVGLLDRAAELLDDVELNAPEDMSRAVESLRCVFCELWNTASAGTQYHQSILVMAESIVNSVESITPGQAAALRGAVIDLRNLRLTERHVEVSRTRFIDEEYNPIAILGELTDKADDTGNK